MLVRVRTERLPPMPLPLLEEIEIVVLVAGAGDFSLSRMAGSVSISHSF